MGKIHVSVPESIHEWIEEQVLAGEYADSSEYVLDLIRGDQERHKQESESAEYALSVDEKHDLEEALDDLARGDLATEDEVAETLSPYR